MIPFEFNYTCNKSRVVYEVDFYSICILQESRQWQAQRMLQNRRRNPPPSRRNADEEPFPVEVDLVGLEGKE